MDGDARNMAVPRAAPRELRLFQAGPGVAADLGGWLLVGYDDIGIMAAPPGQIVTYRLDVSASKLTQNAHGQDQGTAVYRHVEQ